MKKLKEWHVRLIKKWEQYSGCVDCKYTYADIAELVGAPSSESVRSFWRRNKDLFEKERFINEVESFMDKTDTHFGNEARVTSKPVEIVDTNMPKILIFDIETAPLKGHFWRLWKQNISPSQLLGTGNYYIISWAAKWLFDDNTMSNVLTPEEILAEDDTRIVKSIHKLLDECDICVAHFGSGFDIPMLNNRFIIKGMFPPSPFQLIDTKLHASKQFKFPSNKLDAIGKLLGLGQKIKTDWDLWENCMKGDIVALTQMDTYCKQDVKLLEDVYLTLRAWIKPHPNVGLFIDSDVPVCPTCGSKHITWGQEYKTFANTYSAFQCDECGSQGRARKTMLTKEVKQRLTLSLPK